MTPRKAAMLEALKGAYGGDAIFRPSAAARWLTCHGSTQLLAGIPPHLRNTAGEAARIGSGAHALGEIVLKSQSSPTGKQSAQEYVGRKVAINGARADDLTSNPNDFVEVDAEMADRIEEYEKLVGSYMATPGGKLYVERKLTLAHLDPTDPLLGECRGTGDAIVVNHFCNWLVVNDLKYGMMPVPGNSPQLKIYALMAMVEFHQPGKPWEWVGTTVFQPRLPYPKYGEDDWIKPSPPYTPKELLNDFLPQVVEAMDAALEDDPTFTPSESACTWCPGRFGGRCKAFQAAALEIGYDPYDFRIKAALQVGAVPDFALPQPGQKNDYPPEVIVLPDFQGASGEETARVLQKLNMLTIWGQGYKHHAVQLINAGVKVPGYSIERRRGHRAFIVPEKEVVKRLQAEGLDRKDLRKPAALKSPTQIEKMLPASKKHLMQPGFGLVQKPEGEYQLVARDSLTFIGSNPGPVIDLEDVEV